MSAFSLRGLILGCLFVGATVPVSAQSLRSSAMMVSAPQYAPQRMQPAERYPMAPAGMRRARPVSTAARQEVAPEQVHPAVDGNIIEGPLAHEEAFAGDYGDGPFMDGGCGDDCNTCCGPFARLSCFPLFHNGVFSLEAGAHSFTGPANRGGTGSFGFHEGFNWGGTMPFTSRGISAQVGAIAAQSNFQGADFTIDSRNQVFATAGLFRRVDAGLQGGVVIDYMHDQWYYDLDMGQLRGEVSWVFGCNQEVGFWGAGGFSSKVAESRINAPNNVLGPFVVSERWQSNEIFALFYRTQLGCNGSARGFGGVTGQGDGLVGADFQLPLTDCFHLKANAIYLVPAENNRNNGVNEESWNLSIGIVWYPGCNIRCTSHYDRPLMNVADNGVFLMDRGVP